MKELTPEQQAVLDNLDAPFEEMPNKFNWDDEFQRQVLGLLLNDKSFLVSARGLVEADYFTSDVHQRSARILFNYFDKYNQMPNKIIVRQELDQQIIEKGEKIRFHYFNELEIVYQYYNPGIEARDYYVDKITNFAKMMALKKAISKTFDELRKSPEEEATWVKISEWVREALTVGPQFDYGLEYFETVEERYERKLESDEEGEIFTTAFPGLDQALLGGGLGRGEMGSIIGLSGTGKSLFLVGAAVANLWKGKKVLYVSLEMDQDKIAERFDAQLASAAHEIIGINNLLENKNLVVDALKDVETQIDDAYGKLDDRRLVIKQFDAGTMDVNTLRGYYQQLSLWGFQPDLIIIDYVGEMKDFPGIPTWESRYRIIRDLRGFASEHQVCMLTAMQPNRSAREAQDFRKEGFGVIDDDNLADAYGQIRPLDACWSINQIPDEKDEGIARIWVIKHRHGKSRFQIYARYNMRTLKIEEISEQLYRDIWKKAMNEKEVHAEDEMTGAGLVGNGGLAGKKIEKFKDSYDYDNDDNDDLP